MMIDATNGSRIDAAAPSRPVLLADDALAAVGGGLSIGSTLRIYLALWNATMPVKIYVK